MSDLDEFLADAQATADGATEGSWTYERCGATPDDFGIYAEGAGAVVIAAESEADAEFIAASRDLVPTLLDGWRAVLALLDEAPAEPHPTAPQYTPVVSVASVRKALTDAMNGGA